MQDLKVSVVQTHLVWENKTANLLNLESKLDLVETGVDLVVLPEMFNTGFSMKPELFSEKADQSPTLKWMQNQSTQRNIALTGSFMIESEGKFFNRLYFVAPDGKLNFYNKRHLFRMGGEDLHFDQGEEKLIIEYKGWKINFLICYDLRFPVWAKNNFTAPTYDYDLLIVVANWPAVRSRIWKTLLAARAIENQVWTIGVNRIGNDGNNLMHSGNSNIYDPKGIPLFDEDDANEFVKSSTLSFSPLEDFREKFTVGLDWDNFTVELNSKNTHDFEKFSDKKTQKNYNG